MKNFLRNIPSFILHHIAKHYPVTPAGMTDAKDAAYWYDKYSLIHKYHADICEYCFEGLIVLRKKK